MLLYLFLRSFVLHAWVIPIFYYHAFLLAFAMLFGLFLAMTILFCEVTFVFNEDVLLSVRDKSQGFLIFHNPFLLHGGVLCQNI